MSKKLTPAQRDIIYGKLKFDNIRKRQDGYVRVTRATLDRMKSAGLWYEYNGHDHRAGKPHDINTSSPSADGLIAFNQEDPRAAEFPDLKTRARQLCEMENAWEAKLKEQNEALKAETAARQARHREARLVEVKRVLHETDFLIVGDCTDEALLEFAERIAIL